MMLAYRAAISSTVASDFERAKAIGDVMRVDRLHRRQVAPNGCANEHHHRGATWPGRPPAPEPGEKRVKSSAPAAQRSARRFR